eukprot:1531634-Pyramimonas_sp.AAC.1
MGRRITPHRRCISDVGDASATLAWRKSGSASSHIADASAMRRDPPTPSTRIPSGRPRPDLPLRSLFLL